MIYLQLFISFLQIGMFSFGGGYAAMPLIQGQVVTGHKWLSMAEFTDLITISQMTPGPIAVNSATFVGMKVAGVPGALAATLGCILPSCIIVFKIPEHGNAAGNSYIAQTSRGSADRLCRNRDPGQCVLGQQCQDRTCKYQLGYGRNLCGLSYPFAEGEDESYLGHGIGRCYEGGCIRGHRFVIIWCLQV